MSTDDTDLPTPTPTTAKPPKARKATPYGRIKYRERRLPPMEDNARKRIGLVVAGLSVAAAWLYVGDRRIPWDTESDDVEPVEEAPLEVPETSTTADKRTRTDIPRPPTEFDGDDPTTPRVATEDQEFVVRIETHLHDLEPDLHRCMIEQSPTVDALTFDFQVGPAGLEWVELLGAESPSSELLECLGRVLYTDGWGRAARETHVEQTVHLQKTPQN